ncbi:beta-mannosidase [Gordonia sp. CPCC 205515]|uniref:beta-mannosidase n=1 Tax=Gordonia sp. CPCC 205515 TaxID=3140791 RepID=UPI003AF3BC0B
MRWLGRDPSRSAPVVVCAVIAIVALATGCAGPTPRSGTEVTVSHSFTGRVSMTPTGLRLDGRDWWPAGFNAYQLGTDWSVNRGCGAEVDLDKFFTRLPPRSLTRISFFSSFAINKSTGTIDFGPLDAVFAAAARHQQLILPVLTGGPGTCEDEHFKARDWYETGWQAQKSLGGMTFADWMATAVSRWKDQPMLAGWEIVGEPEASICTSQGCNWQVRDCPPGGADVLRAFFDDAGNRLRAVDATHPIFSGFIGGDQCGMKGDDYAKVGASSQIDVLDYHDYGTSTTDFGPAGSDLPTRIKQARSLGKPIVVNEIGVEAGSCLPLQTRADQVRSRIIEQRNAGTAAALVWAFVPDPRPDQCTFDIGYDDPLWSVIADTIN